MAYAGARGPTAAQMRQVLRFGLGDEQLHTASGDLVPAWNPTGKPYELRVANRVFAERTLPIEPAYVALTRDRYGAELGTLDMLHAPGPSAAAINAWVAGQTNGHIHHLVTADMLAVDSRVVLVNCVYFNGLWAEPFERSATHDAAFTLASGQRVQTPTMHAQQHYGYAEVGHGVKLLLMRYEGHELEMIVALPREARGLASLEEQLAGGALDSWLSELHFSKVKVALPLFRIEPPRPLRLAADLRAMGMPLAFSNDADFGAMSRDANVRISDVVHEAFVQCERGGYGSRRGDRVHCFWRGASPAGGMAGVHRGPPVPVLRARRGQRGDPLLGPRRRPTVALSRSAPTLPNPSATRPHALLPAARL
jgi:serpin B